jgi:hypothetical protein
MEEALFFANPQTGVVERLDAALYGDIVSGRIRL